MTLREEIEAQKAALQATITDAQAKIAVFDQTITEHAADLDKDAETWLQEAKVKAEAFVKGVEDKIAAIRAKL